MAVEGKLRELLKDGYPLFEKEVLKAQSRADLCKIFLMFCSPPPRFSDRERRGRSKTKRREIKR